MAPREEAMSPEEMRGSSSSDKTYFDYDQPPLHRIEDIFVDLTQNALSHDLGNALRILKDRPLRVATVCSGTESPLLAMNMVKKGEYQVTLNIVPCLARSLEKLQTGLDLEYEHVFSCEIVAYRQAYIERTCRPPLLFRDVQDLAEPKAYTAYGSLAEVPGNVDLLIAGTSCVDFSTLNNNKKDLTKTGEKGESSRTFFGLLDYVGVRKPSILILENVKAKQQIWDAMADCYNDLGYATEIIDVDTKNFYLPQTRQRKYMVCIRKDNDPKGIVEQKLTQVKALVNSLKRQASCPGGFFLLDENSKQMNQIINDRDLVTKKKSGHSDWSKAQELHRKQRQMYHLGQKNPISNTGSKRNAPKGPDFYMHTWFNSRGEREKDLLDIIFLKGITPIGRDNISFDMNFKERWMNISQAVDRQREGNKGFGIVACITPKGIPFCSTRGGPLTGQEALAMQGLPLSQMIFTRETQEQLQELAGNAMTSTVVCAVTLATLIHGHHFLTERETIDPENKEKKNDLGPEAELRKAKFDEEEMFFSEVAKPAEVEDPAEQVPNLCSDIEKLQRDPPHGPTSMASIQRLEPLEFIKNLRRDLPMRLRLQGLDGSMFDQFLESTSTEHGSIDINDGASEGEESNGEKHGKSVPTRKTGKRKRSNAKRVTVGQSVARKTIGNEPTSTRNGNIIPRPDDRQRYRSVIGAAVADTVHFVNIKRAEAWTVFYEGPHSTLQLVIGRKSIQWLFFAKPPADYPARCLLREIFAKPIAKMTPKMIPDRTILQGRWKISQPISTQSSVTISRYETQSGLSTQLPVYPVRCGVSEKSIADEKVCERMLVKSNGNQNLTNLCGAYELLPNCGTAFGALYKKIEIKARTGGYEDRPIFLFFDPQKCSDIRHDSFVFAFEHNRISGYAPRITIAELSHEWRPESVTATDKPVNLFYRSWLAKPEVSLIDIIDSEVSCQPLIPRPTVNFGGGENSHNYCRLLIASGPTAVLNLPHQDSLVWKHHNIERSPEILKEVAWVFERSSLQMGLEGWRDVNVDGNIQHQLDTICEICHPKMPVPGNDQEAIAYERLIKTKWSKWIIRTRELENDKRELQFALNIRAMAHTAFQNMLSLLKGKTPRVSWRLESNYFDVGRKYHGKFRLKNTEEVSPRRGLPAFLRKEQQRSLDWMIDQERPNIEPFVEMEVDEAPFPALAWRAEVQKSKLLLRRLFEAASAPMKSASWDNGWNVRIPNARSGLKKTNATIIIAPSNIIGQWLEETEKFLAKDYRIKNFVVDIRTSADFKNLKGQRKRMSQIEEARIVLVSLGALNESNFVEFLKKYRWARLVVDEYHLLWGSRKESQSEAILCLHAYSKWILSGTPGLEDFADIKTIARLLGAHLGIDDDGDIKSTNKRLVYTRDQYSHLQKLEKFQPVHSEFWYKNRRSHAQGFLDRFARQNHVEERIEFDTFYDGFPQSADERHVYRILEKHLKDLESGNLTDNSNQLPPSLRDCLEELKKCAGEAGGYEHAPLLCSLSATFTSSPYRFEICQYRSKESEDSFKTNWKELREECKDFMKRYDKFHKGLSKDFSELIMAKLQDKDGICGFGDPELSIRVIGVLGYLLKSIHDIQHGGKVVAMEDENQENQQNEQVGQVEHEDGENEGEDEEERPVADERHDEEEKSSEGKQYPPRIPFPNEVSDQIVRRLEHLATINQDIRFWTTACRLHPNKDGPVEEACQCSSCPEMIKKSEIIILRSCGHILCETCLGKAQHGTCRFRLEDFRVGKNKEDSEIVSKYSSKLRKLTQIIEESPPDDQVLVFCQYEPMFEMIRSLLQDNLKDNFDCICAKGKTVVSSIETFKKKQGKAKDFKFNKVLILLLGGEDMAGQNLQCANHVIFVNPRLAETHDQWKDDMEQAIGRVRRPGQTKQVYVHHLIAEETADVTVLEKWEGHVVRRKDPILAPVKRPSDAWLGEGRRVRQRTS
ncbi:unnamed protein product [Penicillium pancosmium]